MFPAWPLAPGEFPGVMNSIKMIASPMAFGRGLLWMLTEPW